MGPQPSDGADGSDDGSGEEWSGSEAGSADAAPGSGLSEGSGGRGRAAAAEAGARARARAGGSRARKSRSSSGGCSSSNGGGRSRSSSSGGGSRGSGRGSPQLAEADVLRADHCGQVSTPSMCVCGAGGGGEEGAPTQHSMLRIATLAAKQASFWMAAQPGRVALHVHEGAQEQMAASLHEE